jgi:hypothetical protein
MWSGCLQTKSSRSGSGSWKRRSANTLAVINKSGIDRLGERLCEGAISESDLRLLDEFRQSFAPAYTQVIGVARLTLGLGPT